MTCEENHPLPVCPLLLVENALPFVVVEPPSWWDEAGAWVVADRHLPCGRRQHVVRGAGQDVRTDLSADLISEVRYLEVLGA